MPPRIAARSELGARLDPLDIGETVPAASLRRVLAPRVAEGFYEHRGDQRVLYYLVPLAPRAGRAEGAMEIVHFASAIDRQIRAATEDVLVRLSILLLAMVVSTGLPTTPRW